MSAAIDYVIRYLQVLRITDIIDIFIVTIIVYLLLNWLNETRGMQLIKGIAILFVVVAVSNLIGLTALNYILSGIFQFGVIAIVVIFQPELRSILEQMGRSKVGRLLDIAANTANNDNLINKNVDEIVTAAVNMASTKTGALMVIERETRMGEIAKTGTFLDADISSSLLENIFVPNTPLHDGAVMIRGNKIIAAGCFLPLTSNANLSRELGTRHRAALGVSEVSDAVVVVVSEETGKISIAVGGSLTRNLSRETLKRALTKALFTPAEEAPISKLKFWKAVSK